MKQLFLTAALIIPLSMPAVAQDAETQDLEDGFNLMEEGAKLLFRGLMQEIEPAMDDLKELAEEIEPGLRQFALEMGPKMAELLEKIDDFSNYEQPEFLPNGDIIIRRKPDAEPFDPTQGDIEI